MILSLVFQLSIFLLLVFFFLDSKEKAICYLVHNHKQISNRPIVYKMTPKNGCLVLKENEVIFNSQLLFRLNPSYFVVISLALLVVLMKSCVMALWV